MSKKTSTRSEVSILEKGGTFYYGGIKHIVDVPIFYPDHYSEEWSLFDENGNEFFESSFPPESGRHELDFDSHR